jgi:hypothetical protein
MNRRLLGAIAALLLSPPIAAQAQDKAPDKLRYGQIAGSVKSVSSLALYTAQPRVFWRAQTSSSSSFPSPACIT